MKSRAHKHIVKYKIHWHKFIPFVIAEVRNPEWEAIKNLEKKRGEKFTCLRSLYNSNGNWYILEGLDLYWFHWQVFTKTDTNVLFNDTTTLQFDGLTDTEKYNRLIKIAHYDIRRIWNDLRRKK